MHIFLVFLFFSFGTSVWAQVDTDTACKQQDVHSFPILLSSERSLAYHYRYLESYQNNALIVIYIPGGPGATTIGLTDPRVSSNYSLVLTDPRGAGCNDSKNLTVFDISSEKIAEDIVKLILHLKPNKYIIHGHSHGSVVATILSSKLSSQNVKQPEAIILEGVFGQYWDFQKKGVGLVDIWLSNFLKLTPSLQERLRNSEVNPFGLTETQWLGTVYQFNYLGVPAFLPYTRDQLLDFFISNKKGQAMPLDIQKIIESVNFKSLPVGQKTWEAIACNELFNADDGDLELKYSFGVFQFKVMKVCKQTRPNLFSASHWPMNHRILYFIGENDPATPMWQGLYHYKSQPNHQKFGFIVKEAGHRPLQLNMQDCLQEVYIAAASEQVSMSEVVNKTCAAATIPIL